jgi:hypothetical protein
MNQTTTPANIALPIAVIGIRLRINSATGIEYLRSSGIGNLSSPGDRVCQWFDFVHGLQRIYNNREFKQSGSDVATRGVRQTEIPRANSEELADENPNSAYE